MDKHEVLLEVNDLKKYFYLNGDVLGRNKNCLQAVDGVSFCINRGETMGLVGESGCGKSTIGRTIIKLYEPTGGKIVFAGKDITDLKPRAMLPYRKKMQMIFQDPYASLNARMTVGDIIAEPLDIHGVATGKERQDKIKHLLNQVGLNSEHANRYQHEFRGGQRQRVGIARALAVNPDFIICDEPIFSSGCIIQGSGG